MNIDNWMMGVYKLTIIFLVFTNPLNQKVEIGKYLGW